MDVPPPEPLATDPAPDAGPPPPRAFTQGVGTVFQFSGVLLFLTLMAVCCGSSFLSKSVAQRKDWEGVGWGRYTDSSDPAKPVVRATYSANRATTLGVTVGCFLGIALAGLGLGLQAQNRAAPAGAVAVAGLGVVFWAVQFVFVVQNLRSVVLGVIAFGLLALFGGLCALAVGAWREMRRDPPPAGLEVLPKDYKVPYSHYHEDPPEVRLARELEQRRERLAVQQKELEMLEGKLRRSIEEGRSHGRGDHGGEER